MPGRSIWGETHPKLINQKSFYSKEWGKFNHDKYSRIKINISNAEYKKWTAREFEASYGEDKRWLPTLQLLHLPWAGCPVAELHLRGTGVKHPPAPCTCCPILPGLQPQFSKVRQAVINPFQAAATLLNKPITSRENCICFLDSLLNTVSKFGNVSRILK